MTSTTAHQGKLSRLLSRILSRILSRMLSKLLSVASCHNYCQRPLSKSWLLKATVKYQTRLDLTWPTAPPAAAAHYHQQQPQHHQQPQRHQQQPQYHHQHHTNSYLSTTTSITISSQVQSFFVLYPTVSTDFADFASDQS